MKRTDTGADWHCWHRSQVNGFFYLNGTNAATNTGVQYFTASDTEFTFNSGSAWNTSGGTYVAYLFAHDDGGFGDDGEQNVISCGSYTGNGAVNSITLGFEPQFLLIKATNSARPWVLVDTMRGLDNAGTPTDQVLNPNTSGAESGYYGCHPTATGFAMTQNDGDSDFNQNGITYIYIAIRRGPMKTPESGTEVYNAGVTQNNTGRTVVPELGYPPDLALVKTAAVSQWFLVSRLTGGGRSVLMTQSTLAALDFGAGGFDNNVTFKSDGIASLGSYGWMFRRAPGFMDVVCWTGNDVSGRNINHNLGAVPELIIVKLRTGSGSQDWAVYTAPTGNTKYMRLNGTLAATVGSAWWNNTTPTDTVFTVGNEDVVNNTGWTYVAYLFATLAGISKVGTYTGTGTTLTNRLRVLCGCEVCSYKAHRLHG
jgi:hypothetical protein